MTTLQFTGHPDWLPMSAQPALTPLDVENITLNNGDTMQPAIDIGLLQPVTVVQAGGSFDITVTTQMQDDTAAPPLVVRGGSLGDSLASFVMVDTTLVELITIDIANNTGVISNGTISVVTWANVTMDQLRPDTLYVRETGDVLAPNDVLNVAFFNSVSMFDRVAGAITCSEDYAAAITWGDLDAVWSETIGTATGGDTLTFDTATKGSKAAVTITNNGGSNTTPSIVARQYRQSGG